MYLNKIYIKIIDIIFFVFLFAACTEIAEPDLSGIDGLSGYNDPISPLWRKNNGRMVFYAEKSGDTSPYLFANTFAIPGGLSCPCGESSDCGCLAEPAAGSEDCACREVSVHIGGITPNSGEETGVILAASLRNCTCTAGSSCGCTGPNDDACTCEKKEFSSQQRIEFTIKPADNTYKYNIRFYNADSETAVKEEPGNTHIDPDKENKLTVKYNSVDKTFIFSINDAPPIYPPAAGSAPVFQFEITEKCVLYYYTNHGASAPSRQSPFKREFRTEFPQQYP